LEIDFAPLEPKMRYKLLTAFIVPRPIAFVSTVNSDGAANAAPFSFFNVFGEEPPVVVLGFDRRADGTLKDTVRNIQETGEFVVNMVDERIAQEMNDCAVDFPHGVDEFAETGLTPEPSHLVKPPRIKESPAAFECRHMQTIQFKPHRLMIMGEVVWLRTTDGVLDPETMRIRDDTYAPVGRLYGNYYSRQNDRFELTRQTYDEWVAAKKEY